MNSITADRYFYIVGRFLLGLYFLLPGLAKVFLFQDNLDVVILREVPFPAFSLSLVAIAQIFFGTMLMIGKYVHVGALVLAVVTLLINFYIHILFFNNLIILSIIMNFQYNIYIYILLLNNSILKFISHYM